MKMHFKVIIILVFVIIVYVVLGGVGFHYLESSQEQAAQVDIATYIGDFQDRFTCLTPEDVANFLAAVKKAQDSGVVARNNTDSSDTNWDFQSAIFFSVTVITTIGYGHISPSTNGGRIFCVIFALFGIPLFLITASALGEKFRKLGSKIQEKASCKSLEHKPKVIKVLTTLLIISIGFILLMVFPAAIFFAVESWTMQEAMYYVYITLTTIGFGDYVPGIDVESKSYRGVYRLITAFWILIGLTWMAGVISTLQDLVSDLVDKVGTKVAKSDQEQTDDEQNTKADSQKKDIGDAKNEKAVA